MLAQVKKLIEPAAGGDFTGRLGAWWNGKDYVPPEPTEEGASDSEAKAPPAKLAEAPAPAAEPETPAPAEAEETPAAAEPSPAPEAPSPAFAPAAARSGRASSDLRVRAVTALWGAERLVPGTADLDQRILDMVFDAANGSGDIGFIGADAALLNAARGRSDRTIHAAEWRTDCIEHIRALAPDIDVQASDTDRPRGLGDGNLEGLVSVEAFAYADHKAGLVARAFRALSDNGRWIILDTVRHSAKTPAECFASAWAEPNLTTSDEIEELLKLAGFAGVTHVCLTSDVLAAARAGYRQLGEVLDAAVRTGLDGREGAIFLQELTWEIQSWRARMRAFEGGALSVDLWIADKDPTRAATAALTAGDATPASEPADDLLEAE
ncbi:MAG: hypothetical protein GC155_01350 [Alphaproteobacteria bacterium]|nr:hypothetical protein [Alphaproteobacteria bacterium]